MKSFVLGLVLAITGLTTAVRAEAETSSSSAIVSAQTNQCWDVKDFSTADGAIIQMYPCTGTTNQMWAFQVYGYSGESPMARIVNIGSGLCAAAESSNPASGAIGLVQRNCNNNDPTQQWTISAPFATYTIVSGTSTWIVNGVMSTRRIVNVASHWCVRTEDAATFWRPTLAASCANPSNDLHSSYRLSGAR